MIIVPNILAIFCWVKNPISDLINTGLVYSFKFEGKTCSDIKSMMTENDILDARRETF
jgi:hypothetical protein